MNALPAQQALIRSKSRVVAFVGGFGSGKTRAAVYKSLVLGLQNAPCVGIFVEPTYSMVRDVAVRSFRDVLDELGIPYSYHRTDHVMRIADSFDVLFRSGDQPERLVGINAGWAVIDEPAQQSEEVAKNVLSRIRDPRSVNPQLVLTGTPEGFNWFYRWCHGDNVELIRAKTTDNPFLDPRYVAEMRQRYTDEEVEAYINGEFVRFEGGWYKVRPAVLEPVEVLPVGLQVFRPPTTTSGQTVIGVDTAGGLAKDSSAVVVMDKRDATICASWTDAEATVDKIADVVEAAFAYYTRGTPAVYPGFTKPGTTQIPLVLIEINGIGRATFQSVTNRRIPAVEVSTTESTRYEGMLAAKRGVEGGVLEGPLKLAEEADELVVDNGRFVGPKDLSMAIGFCLRHISQSPYKPPETFRDKARLDFSQYLGKKATW